MELLIIIRFTLLAASFFTLGLSVIFLFFPDLYVHIEEVLSTEVFHSMEFSIMLEGRIETINDWMFEKRTIFGTIFILLSLYNIKSLLLLY